MIKRQDRRFAVSSMKLSTLDPLTLEGWWAGGPEISDFSQPPTSASSTPNQLPQFSHAPPAFGTLDAECGVLSILRADSPDACACALAMWMWTASFIKKGMGYDDYMPWNSRVLCDSKHEHDRARDKTVHPNNTDYCHACFLRIIISQQHRINLIRSESCQIQNDVISFCHALSGQAWGMDTDRVDIPPPLGGDF